MNFLHFAVFLFVVCSVILLVVSLATPAPAADKTAGLTFETKRPAESTSNAAWRARDRILSIVLVICVLAVWIYFRE
jgi:SSS family solute:Na+ symporter